jgi:hypothetical protein
MNMEIGRVYLLKYKYSNIFSIIRVLRKQENVYIEFNKIFPTNGSGFDADMRYFYNQLDFDSRYTVVSELEDKGDDPLNYPFLII